MSSIAALDPDRAGHRCRPRVIGLIREEIGFRRAADDRRSVDAGAVGRAWRRGPRAALAAGCDLVLHCNGDRAEMAEVVAAARGRWRRRAGARRGGACRAAARPTPLTSPRARGRTCGDSGEAGAMPDRCLRRRERPTRRRPARRRGADRRCRRLRGAARPAADAVAQPEGRPAPHLGPATGRAVSASSSSRPRRCGSNLRPTIW